jgi:F-box interacting protein
MSEPVKIIPPFFRPQNLVIGCCNSLVCILILNYNDLYSPFDDFEIVIWNPSIKKYKSLPFEPIEDNLLEQSLAFGDDPVNNDYKVLVIVFVTIDYRMKPLEILVYSLKAHSWGRVEDQWPCKDSNIWSIMDICITQISMRIHRIDECTSFLLLFQKILEKKRKRKRF